MSTETPNLTSRIASRMKADLVSGVMITACGNARVVGRHGTIDMKPDHFERWLNGTMRIASPSFMEFSE